MHAFRYLAIFAAIFTAFGVSSIAQGQGLLWSLPEDGKWVKYVGKYRQKEEQPGNNAGPLQLEWLSELTIKSVGEQMAMFEGKEVPCRWIEFKVVTGLPSTGGVEAGAKIDPGPFGVRYYKVLVPVERVNGQLKDANGLPVMFIPIIEGSRKIGGGDAQPKEEKVDPANNAAAAAPAADANAPDAETQAEDDAKKGIDTEPIKEKVLAFYPVLGMFANYPDLAVEGQESNLDLPGYADSPVSAKLLKGTLKQKNSEISSENVGQIWLSDKVPFGWAKYQVKLTRQRKSKFAPESEFAPVAEIEVEMAAVETGTGAKSEIPLAKAAAAPAAAAPAETAQPETK